jgi:hypothetical protein
VLFSVESFDRNGGIWVIDADGKKLRTCFGALRRAGMAPGQYLKQISAIGLHQEVQKIFVDGDDVSYLPISPSPKPLV